MKRIVNVSVLPGEPTDGSGRVCIHLFVPSDTGPFVEPHVLHSKLDDQGNPVGRQVEAKPTRGRLACSATRMAAPVTRDGVTKVTQRSDDPRAVTCPKCIASEFYVKMMERITQIEAAQ